MSLHTRFWLPIYTLHDACFVKDIYPANNCKCRFNRFHSYFNSQGEKPMTPKSHTCNGEQSSWRRYVPGPYRNLLRRYRCTRLGNWTHPTSMSSLQPSGHLQQPRKSWICSRKGKITLRKSHHLLLICEFIFGTRGNSYLGHGQLILGMADPPM